jgi:hypothetical protein
VTVNAAAGFIPMNLTNRWLYEPWFAGNSTAGTISTTTTQSLAIDAPGAAKALGYKFDPNPPTWLAGFIGVQQAGLRGYVYAFGNIGVREAMRVSSQTAGVEEVYLAIPNAAISEWWVVLGDRRTVGPVTYPPAVNAPIGVPNVSLAAGQLV